ncbi:GHMP kinase [Heliorestis acidaminivorans]|nr:GHMP kinase [Heliorestis acidaminivorans]
MKGWAQVPGTCGELAQGILGKQALHITCPIDCWVSAEVSLEPGQGNIDGLQDRSKTRRALEKLLDQWQLRNHYDVQINLHNPLPKGKGMASSTADLCATLYALAQACQRTLTTQELSNLILAIEPSDGLFLPGISIFDHRSGSKAETITSKIPAIDLLIYDMGGEVDTVIFNSQEELIELNIAKVGQVQQAFDLLVSGLQSGERKKIGQGATISALANQNILPKVNLEIIAEETTALGALGVAIAHSGTTLGILVEREQREKQEKLWQWMNEQSQAYTYLGHYRLVGGGPRYQQS